MTREKRQVILLLKKKQQYLSEIDCLDYYYYYTTSMMLYAKYFQFPYSFLSSLFLSLSLSLVSDYSTLFVIDMSISCKNKTSYPSIAAVVRIFLS